MKLFMPIGAAFPLITSARMRAEPQAKVKPSAPCPTFSHKLLKRVGPMTGAPPGVAGRSPAQALNWQ